MSTGLSKVRLERMRRILSGHLERKEMPGLVALVSHCDRVHVETLGTLAFDNPAPMRRDTIFRLASLSKPVTAVAAMILVEECKLRLDDAIDPWLPELANRRVLTSISARLDDVVAARRAISLRDLLSFRMGFGSVMAPADSTPIQKAIREYKIGGDGPPRPAQAPATDEWLRRLGALPLLAQPGERWMYHVASDVLGVLVARVSGQSLGAFLRERIFAPLDMNDTGFHVPAEKRARLATSYVRNPQTRALEIYDGAANSDWAPDPPFESGGGGLAGTIVDYFAFCRMLLNKGRHDSEQILSPASVELMTSDQLTADQRAGAELFLVSTVAGASAWRWTPGVPKSSTRRGASVGAAASARRLIPIRLRT